MKSPLAVFLLAMLALCLLLPSHPYARDLKKELDEIGSKIESQKERLDNSKKLEVSILDELDGASRELDELRKELDRYRQKLKDTSSRINAVTKEIVHIKGKLSERNEWMKRKLQAMQKYGKYADLAVLISSSEDISELLRKWRYLETLASYEYEIMEGYRKDLETLERKAAELEALKDSLKKSENQVKLMERTLSMKKARKETLLVSVRREKSAYERMLRELKASSEKVLELIRQSESEGLDDRGFNRNKGKLLWPVKGRVSIPYGTQKDPEFNTPVFRNGIYIETENTSTAKAVYGGKVVFADRFKGYGQLVIINHGGGYHTLYANLSEIFLKNGDIIEEKAEIGRVGESAMLNNPSLYFEIRYKGKPLNPVQWLR